MKEIGANLLLTEHIGRAHVVGREPADCLDVDVPGPLSKTGKPHVVDHTLTQRGHGRSPFEFRHQELGPGTRADTPARSPQRLHPLRRSRSVQRMASDLSGRVSLRRLTGSFGPHAGYASCICGSRHLPAAFARPCRYPVQSFLRSRTWFDKLLGIERQHRLSKQCCKRIAKVTLQRFSWRIPHESPERPTLKEPSSSNR